ncbi:MAG: hypothetical protein RLZZ126_665 [Pseudomonadota bacterium]|jgi:outer membrane protein assembly factor BamD
MQPIALRLKLSVLCLVLLAACASKEVDPTANMSPNRLYAEAKDEMGSGSWEKASALLEKLEGRAAGTPLAQQAQLDRAYAKYKSAETAEALAILDRFMKLHPASPALDYAWYLKGIITFNDELGFFSSFTKQDLSERDQKASKDSFEAFRELVSRFPESKYAPDARQRMTYIVNSLAQYEVHVARYYYSRGAYLAAINRAQIALADYRAVPALEEAMYIVFRAYDALGMVELRDDARRVMEKNYPNSEMLRTGRLPGGSGPWWKVW